MSDTMMSMELRFADYLFPNQLEEGDLIKVEDEYFTIGLVTEQKVGYVLTLLDDFNDESELVVGDDEKLEWYVFIEEDSEDY